MRQTPTCSANRHSLIHHRGRLAAIVLTGVALHCPAQDAPTSGAPASPEEMEAAFRDRIASLHKSSTQSYLEALDKLKSQYSGTGRSDDAAAVAREEARARRILKTPAPHLFPLPGESLPGGNADGLEKDQRDALSTLQSIGLILPLRQPGDKRLLPKAATASGKVTIDSDSGVASNFLGPGDALVWQLSEGTVSQGSTYEIVLEYAAARRVGGGSMTVSLGDSSQSAVLPGFGNWNHFRHQSVGTIEIDSLPASLTLDTRRASGADSVCRLRAVILRPAEEE